MAGEERSTKDRLFIDLDGDGIEDVTEVESLCFNCQGQGMTRLMLTMIPHFREVILSSFSCDACGFEDCSIQSGGRIQDKGVRLKITVKDDKDLNRQVVKSEWASLSVPEVDFQQEGGKRGEVNTIEGFLSTITQTLASEQPQRQEMDPESAAKIEEFILKVTRLRMLEEPFTFIIDDPSGNSYIENPYLPEKDPSMTETRYVRTRKMDVQIGIAADDEEDEVKNTEAGQNGEPAEKKEENDKEKEATGKEDLSLQEEVHDFQSNCPSCNAPCETKMKMTDIPFFKQVIIMASNCDVCGYRDNEVKAGTGIEPLGKRITLHLTDVSDLSRDVLKEHCVFSFNTEVVRLVHVCSAFSVSALYEGLHLIKILAILHLSETCGVRIPEFDLELVHGTLGGRFTTVEGLLVNIKDQLKGKNPFIIGDSAEENTAKRLEKFCDKLQKVIDGELLDIHFILEDPAGNSYLQNLYAPDEDPEMKMENYERSYEENEELGLNDMRTENYTNDQ